MPWFTIIGGAVAIVIVFFIFLGIWASRYTKVGPNEVLVISGRKRKVVDPDGTARSRFSPPPPPEGIVVPEISSTVIENC